jgi:regulator of sigma E protease
MLELLSHPGTLLLAILALGILIIVHEGGHFLVARWCGMRVDRFSIGFGPRLVSFTRGETTYQIAAIPLGGFVQIAGLNPGEEGISPDDPRAYPNRPAWQRMATIFAGPGTNYLFAAIMMIGIYLAWGVPAAGNAPVVNGLVAGKPAAAAGFQEDDEIVAVGAKKVNDLAEVAPLISASKGQPLDVEVLRHGQPLTLHVRAEQDGSEYRIGVQLGPRAEWEQVPVGQRIKAGLLFPIEYSSLTLHMLVKNGFRGFFRDASGPIGIVKEMHKRISNGLRDSLLVVAVVSICLGLFNLLPIPALDGGRMVFIGWELISRRKVNERFEATVHMAGLLVLLTLLIVIVIKNDLGFGRLLHR